MDDTVVLSVPAKPDYIITVRLVSSSLAGRLGCDLEQIEDIKMAVAEACLQLIDTAGEGGMLNLAFKLAETFNVTISSSCERERSKTPEIEIGALLLDTLMDEVKEIATPGGERALELTKRL